MVEVVEVGAATVFGADTATSVGARTSLGGGGGSTTTGVLSFGSGVGAGGFGSDLDIHPGRQRGRIDRQSPRQIGRQVRALEEHQSRMPC